MDSELSPIQVIEVPLDYPLTEQQLTLRSYLLDLGLTWEALQGKKILDLGAGQAEFAAYCRQNGVDVISIDDILGGMGQDKPPVESHNYFLAKAGQLPFADASFDLILSRAVLQSSHITKDDLVKIINEADRVLKSGGEFRFGPGPFLGGTKFGANGDYIHSASPNTIRSGFDNIVNNSLEFVLAIKPGKITSEPGHPRRETGFNQYYKYQKS